VRNYADCCADCCADCYANLTATARRVVSNPDLQANCDL
jgi:hypothetical protein